MNTTLLQKHIAAYKKHLQDDREKHAQDLEERKLRTESPLDPYVQGVFAFPSAYVEARWGTTGYVHCIKDEQLYDYIVENKKSKKLSQKEIDSISQAFLALARMDKDFGQDNK